MTFTFPPFLRFEFKPEAEPDVDFDADLTFYDNGAVKENDTGEFVIKCDQVKSTV